MLVVQNGVHLLLIQRITKCTVKQRVMGDFLLGNPLRISFVPRLFATIENRLKALDSVGTRRGG